ncbi:metallophosphoesterase family protein [Kiritimatiella glycovorans]|uniref:Exonuclease subunit SbcD n=1 Tax=Kiritimatiella glycovorans TaxID=1307763 RepID=A0A0G3EIW5_9BACT|nr:metallophosphoesterase [Kiritimatiella glycovorans]AKJ64775.1 exonuclease subunit SbcD [Kiritimatiella glycovorans]
MAADANTEILDSGDLEKPHVTRFLHTSDWQLGMTRHFLSEGAQERYSQARFDAIRTMGRIAKKEHCQFIVVAGDTFESNQVDRKTVARTLEALKDVSVPVYILPGNHDPLDAASVYHSSVFIDRKPSHVHVIEDTTTLNLGDGIEIVGAPWMSKRPSANPIVGTLESLTPASGVVRICVAHGAVDQFTPDKDSALVMKVTELERAIGEGKVQFVALGDRHSLTKVGGDYIWYSGTPESTDFTEMHSGFANLVEIADGEISTKEVQVGQWHFVEHQRELNTAEDVESLRKLLEDVSDKERSVIRLNLLGSLTLSLHALLQDHLASAADVFGACDVRDENVIVIPDDTDFTDLGFSGFADAAVQRLRSTIEEDGDDSATARDALMLLLRLGRGV